MKKLVEWFWDKSPWYDAEEFLIALKHPSGWWGISHVRHRIWFLRCWFSYAPVLWNDMDVNHGEILGILAHKLKRMKRHFDTCPNHGEREMRAAEIAQAIEIIERVHADDYFIDEWVKHFEKWEKKPTKEIHDGQEVYCYPSMSDEERAPFGTRSPPLGSGRHLYLLVPVARR